MWYYATPSDGVEDLFEAAVWRPMKWASKALEEGWEVGCDYISWSLLQPQDWANPSVGSKPRCLHRDDANDPQGEQGEWNVLLSEHLSDDWQWVKEALRGVELPSFPMINLTEDDVNPVTEEIPEDISLAYWPTVEYYPTETVTEAPSVTDHALDPANLPRDPTDPGKLFRPQTAILEALGLTSGMLHSWRPKRRRHRKSSPSTQPDQEEAASSSTQPPTYVSVRKTPSREIERSQPTTPTSSRGVEDPSPNSLPEERWSAEAPTSSREVEDAPTDPLPEEEGSIDTPSSPRGVEEQQPVRPYPDCPMCPTTGRRLHPQEAWQMAIEQADPSLPEREKLASTWRAYIKMKGGPWELPKGGWSNLNN